MEKGQQTIYLTVVYDDFAGVEQDFHSSYGFSLIIDIQDNLILFDTGTRSDVLMTNLHVLGVDARNLRGVILSHNHYDHTGGLAGILEQQPDIPVYVHSKWDAPNLAKGFDVPQKNRVTLTAGRECTELAPGLSVTNPQFSKDYGIIHEQACFIRAGSSDILITGCCHPGLDVYLDEIYGNSIGEESNLYIIGGFHGFEFSVERARVVDSRIREIVCCHCTKNYDRFKQQFGQKCHRVPVGKKMSFPGRICE